MANQPTFIPNFYNPFDSSMSLNSPVVPWQQQWQPQSPQPQPSSSQDQLGQALAQIFGGNTNASADQIKAIFQQMRRTRSDDQGDARQAKQDAWFADAGAKRDAEMAARPTAQQNMAGLFAGAETPEERNRILANITSARTGKPVESFLPQPVTDVRANTNGGNDVYDPQGQWVGSSYQPTEAQQQAVANNEVGAFGTANGQALPRSPSRGPEPTELDRLKLSDPARYAQVMARVGQMQQPQQQPQGRGGFLGTGLFAPRR